ncbi:protein NLRC3 [Coregonus clupeaformis]|uniref:protein NLRC3 n=1 Tax=Coregonus clupeaformis TaxID=59861 RepID=UPI001E1C3AA9|nr:protein NLRC3 [Coregonus clupeaformis]
MAVGPCSIALQERRVQLVESWSQNVTHLQELLYQVGALTEEDLSLVRGGGRLGVRDCMRNLLDVLHGRGEEACRAFFHVLQSQRANKESESTGEAIPPEGSGPSSIGSGPTNMQEYLRKHKGVLGRQHSPIDYLSIRTGRCISSESGDEPGSFTDITLSRCVGYTVPLQYHQHEAAMVGDAFRSQDQVCTFQDVYQRLLSVPGEDVTLLSGVAGSGKTTVVRRLVHEWARDSESQKIVLSLSFRELNLLSEPQTLHKLLLVHYSHLKPVLARVIDSQPGRILLILDGLDEFRFPLDFERSPKCSDPERTLGMGEMVVNLIKGHLLPGISILVTSRPHAISKVPTLLVTQLYSVLGFSKDQQRHYFEQSCSSPLVASAVWGYVSSYQPLQLMCRIPAFCWIVSTALRDGATCCLSQVTTTTLPSTARTTQAGSSDTSTTNNSHVKPITITAIYCCFLKSILVFHGEGRSQEGCSPQRLQEAPRVLQEMRPTLRDLGALAFKGLLERRFLFDQADLSSFSLDCSELSKTFLVEILREDRASLTYQRSFHFLHTSVQEFLAALYYVLQALSGSDPFSGLKSAVGVALFPVALHKVLTSTANKLLRPRRLLRRYVKKAFSWGGHHQSGHMDLFCRFVSGLLVPQTRVILDGLFRGRSQILPSPSSSSLSLSSPPPPPPPTPPFLLSLLHSQLQCGRLSPERQVNVCHCLYEAQDPGLAERLQGWLQVLAQQQVPDQSGPAKRDWSELAFLLQLIPDLQDLNLEAQGLDADGLRRLLPVLPLFSTLRLGQNPLGPEGAVVLACAVQSPDCRVERLWVVGTGLGCEGLKVLTEGLKDNHTVVDLRMAINHIGDVGAGCLADLLRTNHTLKDIRLRDNQITDKGLELLMEALTENTTLEHLWMFDNKLSKEGVRKLKEFARSTSHLDIKVCI